MSDPAARAEAILDTPESVLADAAPAGADELLAIGEAILETWIETHGLAPTTARSEGFRLLALHRQAAKGEPSFNACRETCRELVYHHNLVRLDPAHHETPRRLRLGAMVARHLALFVAGKMAQAKLGEFCCSSRPLRQNAQDGDAAL